MERSSASEAPWYERAFERVYLLLYPHRDDAEAERHAPAICHLLGVRAGDRVLDVACGAGRHARALGRRGLRVTGVDLSPDLLEEARERSPGTPGAPSYLRWDARHLPFQMQFEGAISMFTSMGYFEGRDDDLAILRGVRRALVPGGRFLLDFLNEARVRSTLRPWTEVRQDGLGVRMERRVDEEAPGGPRVCKRVQAVDLSTGLVRASFEERVRLYRPEEIDALLEEAGLRPHGPRRGGLDGEPFGPDAPRLVRVAERPRGTR